MEHFNPDKNIFYTIQGQLVSLFDQFQLFSIYNYIYTYIYIYIYIYIYTYIHTRTHTHTYIYTSYAMLSSGICHTSLYFLYTHEPLSECVYEESTSDKWQCSTVSHKKALHNYFIPCLNLRKTYGNFRKSLEISQNFRKLWKSFKPVFEKL